MTSLYEGKRGRSAVRKPHSSANTAAIVTNTDREKMPFFKFPRKKPKYQQKSSSMGSLYKDYSGVDDATGNSLSKDRARVERRVSFEDVNIHDLQKRNEALANENNLLKLKVEVLLDMLAQKTAEAELQENDILKMKNILANS